MATSIRWPPRAALATVLGPSAAGGPGLRVRPAGLTVSESESPLSRLRPRFPEPAALAALGLGQVFVTDARRGLSTRDALVH